MASEPENNASPREVTFSSPFVHAVDPERYGSDPYFQHELILYGMKMYLSDPFEKNVDLRGHRVEVVVHDDGLRVTLREV